MEARLPDTLSAATEMEPAELSSAQTVPRLLKNESHGVLALKPTVATGN